MVEWEDGSITYEPLTTIAVDDPATCTLYVKEKCLLETDGWKRFKNIAKNDKKLERMLNRLNLSLLSNRRSTSLVTKYQGTRVKRQNWIKGLGPQGERMLEPSNLRSSWITKRSKIKGAAIRERAHLRITSASCATSSMMLNTMEDIRHSLSQEVT
jgi:hypothetical protein